ncbi:hypothetical protein TPELB_25130 [Terrisporobacter petrolearius]|uniref:DUF4275 family protein n=1 Tax=Terrisporobacter petrolearius TaxID=1460447 RepID=A0ABZ3FEJ1_9FIRM
MVLLDKKINFQALDNLEEIKNKWIEVFAGHLTEKERIDEIGMDGYLWHVFSYEKRDCLEGNEARKAFDELRKRGYYIFFEDYVYDYYSSEYENKVFEVFDGDKAKAKDFNKEDDIYIVDKYFRWTYVNTHERNWLGPYFCKL